ncbi:hypothetical protein RLOatenuis_0470 [Rickettsiales bacterium]|nr:hypothetical protein RLOatenuis_0470 [Rickettsiales bacterium]
MPQIQDANAAPALDSKRFKPFKFMPVFSAIDDQQVPDIIYDPKYCAFWIDKETIVPQNILQEITKHSLKTKNEASSSLRMFVMSIEKLIDLFYTDDLAEAGWSTAQHISVLESIKSCAIEKLISRNSEVAHNKQKSPFNNQEIMELKKDNVRSNCPAAVFIEANQDNLRDRGNFYEFVHMHFAHPDCHVNLHLFSNQEETDPTRKMHIVSMSEDHEKQVKEIQTKCNDTLSNIRTYYLSQLDALGPSDSESCTPDAKYNETHKRQPSF